MKKIRLILGIHNHQPVGNFDFVLDKAYQNAYRPFLDLLRDFPGVRVGMHTSGILYEWLDKQYPEYSIQLRTLTDRGQIELIGGGFYEPILPIIPHRDQVGQIQRLQKYLLQRYEQATQGMWLAERVWEPHLPSVLNQVGVRYVILDDTHFLHAGLSADDLSGYYITEDQGATLALFPISQQLRYLIPFEAPEKTIDYLRDLAEKNENAVAVFADDGEKFGIWPDTYLHVYENGWLQRFFEALEANRDWIEVCHFSDVLRSVPPKGKIYLPTASYSEMLHWALPLSGYRNYELFQSKLKEEQIAESFNAFVRGGFWRNFFSKYAESNRMHKKMLRVSARLAKVAEAIPKDDKVKQSLLESAQNHLWASQCNCPYWHGVFGGIYLNNIRFAVYRYMLNAEVLADQLDAYTQGQPYRLDETDFDANGKNEILFESPKLNAYLDPHHGATLFEIDYKEIPMHVTDILTRREEGYHHQLAEASITEPSEKNTESDDSIASIHDRVLSKEPDLHRHLIYDQYERRSFRDHVLTDNCDLEAWQNQTYSVYADLADASYDVERKEYERYVEITCLRETELKMTPMRIEKKYKIFSDDPRIEVHYRWYNKGKTEVKAKFGTEINLTLLAGQADDRFYAVGGRKWPDGAMQSSGTFAGIRSLNMIDGWQNLNIALAWSETADVWRYPIETVSLSEEGFERVYQGSCIFVHWPMWVKPNDQWNVSIVLHFSRDTRKFFQS